MTTFVAVKKANDTLFKIEREVFETLFDHTIARRRAKFMNALESGLIKYDDFMYLARISEVPYPLFFLKLSEVRKVILEYEKKVYFGVSKSQMSIASRGEVRLADISLVLKDITRKQNFIKKYIDDKNQIPGMFKRRKGTVVERAESLRSIVGYNFDDTKKMNKETTFNHLNEGLAANNVFISLYAHNYTPQSIEQDLQFSGIAINDKKCPFLFIKAGDNNSRIELWGRRLFTAALLLSCLCENDCGPLTMDGKSGELVDDKHYIFAEEFLMPKARFEKERIRSLADISDVANTYAVSSSAVIMRAFRIGMINERTKDAYLQSLRTDWENLLRVKGGGKALGLEKAINRYNNPAVVRIILGKYHDHTISAQDTKNLLCYKKGESFKIVDLESHV